MARKDQSLLQKSASWISSKVTGQRMQIPKPFWSCLRKRKIAIPREPGYNRQGFWDIKAKQEDLFSNLEQKVFE